MDTGRTRWRRFGVVMVLSVGASAGLVLMVANGAIAATFSVSGQQFKVHADQLVAKGFVQYGTVDGTTEPGGDHQTPVPVAVSAMKSADLTNLCQSVVTDLGMFGEVTLRIEAGTGKKHVTAQNMVVDMTQLNGQAHFTNIEIGTDAAKLDKGPTNDEGEKAQRRPGFFSQQADKVVIDDLKQTAWSTNAGEFYLYDLNLGLKKGRHECF